MRTCNGDTYGPAPFSGARRNRSENTRAVHLRDRASTVGTASGNIMLTLKVNVRRARRDSNPGFGLLGLRLERVRAPTLARGAGADVPLKGQGILEVEARAMGTEYLDRFLDGGPRLLHAPQPYLHRGRD